MCMYVHVGVCIPLQNHSSDLSKLLANLSHVHTVRYLNLALLTHMYTVRVTHVGADTYYQKHQQ
jgi:hypothetical protein